MLLFTAGSMLSLCSAIVPMDHSGSGKKHQLIMDNVSVGCCQPPRHYSSLSAVAAKEPH